MTHDSLTDEMRQAARRRPAGRPLMHQAWGRLLFMHWRIDAARLRPLIPDGLHIDTYDGAAWIAIVPFTMWDVRFLPPYAPRIPGWNAMHELNVRTYVHRDGVPGVWFFSLDINSRLAVLGARATYSLPYYNAHITLADREATIDYALERTGGPPAAFRASWTGGERLPEAQPGSLDYFLTERYCLYSARRGRLCRADIFHDPWPLQTATLSSWHSTMLEPHGLPAPEGAPLLHYAHALSVEIWPLKRVA